jgi:hypothetical protein
MGFVNYKKGCTRLAAASDKVYQLLAHGRWFSLGTPASSTTKTGRHDIAEILLKVALKHQKSKSTNKTDLHDITEILLKVELNIITSYLFSKSDMIFKIYVHKLYSFHSQTFIILI